MSEKVHRCAICHKRLTDPKSVERGIGPECWSQDLQEREENGIQITIFDTLPIPEGSYFYFERIQGRPVVTVMFPDDTAIPLEHGVLRHSPDGFEWGYGGSGPAELALNISRRLTDPMTADRIYQDLKWTFIAPMPEAGGMLSADKVREWIQDKTKEESA